MIAFFKKKYTVKRFGDEIIVNGYPTAGYYDIKNISLDVQEQDSTMVAEPHGKRTPKTLDVFGSFKFIVSDSPETKGDLICYKDQWYECKSCVGHHNTILRHYHSTFMLDPNGGVYHKF